MSKKLLTVSGYSMSVVSALLMFLLLFGLQVSANEKKTILIIGDSLSAAHGIPVETSWPQLLQQKLNENNSVYNIINTSISGDTSYTALNRSKTLLPQFKPDICLIAIGANDGLQGLSLKQLKINLYALVKLCQQHTDKIILIEMKLPLNYGKAFSERFSNIYHDITKQSSIKLLPFFMESFALDMSMFLDDRIHPAEHAQPVMANIVWQGLKDLVQ